MTPLDLDEYLDHNDVEINEDTLSIAHHGILGMRWGRLNGPPYPLGKGDHSAAEKSAAAKAGVKVGKSSGKGSIENVGKGSSSGSKSTSTKKKKVEKPETPEEHEAKRQAAIRSGSRVQVKKYASEMSMNELNEAVSRIGQMDKLKTKPDNNGGLKAVAKNLSPKEREKREALESGDLRRIRKVAPLATKDELQTAINKADLMAKMDKKLAGPSAMEKIDNAMQVTKEINGWARTGADVWNTIAGYANAFGGTDLQKIDYGNGNKKKGGKKGGNKNNNQNNKNDNDDDDDNN